MRIGIFGGSFDPIHYGHLILAENCREQARLDQVWFVPSSIAPHKRDGATLTDRQRIELIQLAIGGHDAFVASDLELRRGGVSYTVETLSEIHEQNPLDELFILIGSDSLHQLDTWREPARICELAIPLVVGRPGAKPVDLELLSRFVGNDRLQAIMRYQITSPLIEISSTDIRQRVLQGRTIRYLTPRAVEKYIETQKLYRASKVTQDRGSDAQV
jgi:nicotinate-nucleotide adenylyltransferase